MDELKWLWENAFNIIFTLSILFGMYKTWRASRANFWSSLRASGRELINQAETKYNSGEGSLKKEWVVDQLLEEFGSKYSILNKKTIGKIVDSLVLVANQFKK